MKNRINLYQSELHPRIELLTLGSALTAWLVCIGLMVSVYIGYATATSQYDRQLSVIDQQLASKSLHLDTLKQTLATRQQDPALVEEISTLEMEYEDSQRLLLVLNNRTTAKDRGFARLMSDLATHHHQQVALTRIVARGSAMQFEGQVTEPDILPEWVNGLGNAPYFNGVEFASARLYRNEQGLQFALASQHLNSDGESADE